MLARHHPHATQGVVSLPSHLGRGVRTHILTQGCQTQGTTSASPENRGLHGLKTKRCGGQGARSMLACCQGGGDDCPSLLGGSLGLRACCGLLGQ